MSCRPARRPKTRADSGVLYYRTAPAIRKKESTSRLAPPTSAPSISASPRKLARVFGLDAPPVEDAEPSGDLRAEPAGDRPAESRRASRPRPPAWPSCPCRSPTRARTRRRSARASVGPSPRAPRRAVARRRASARSGFPFSIFSPTHSTGVRPRAERGRELLRDDTRSSRRSRAAARSGPTMT